MERKNQRLRPKTIMTAKTIAKSLSTYHCHPEQSAAESKDLVEVTATRRGEPRPLNYPLLPSNYSQTTLKLLSNYSQTTLKLLSNHP